MNFGTKALRFTSARRNKRKQASQVKSSVHYCQVPGEASSALSNAETECYCVFGKSSSKHKTSENADICKQPKYSAGIYFLESIPPSVNSSATPTAVTHVHTITCTIQKSKNLHLPLWSTISYTGKLRSIFLLQRCS